MNCWRTPSEAVTDARSRNSFYVLPRAHACALGPLRFEGRMDRERHFELLRSGEHGIVVGVTERPTIVCEGRDVRAVCAVANRAFQLAGRRGRVAQ